MKIVEIVVFAAKRLWILRDSRSVFYIQEKGIHVVEILFLF
tara:strand:+ start:162 stop:284 length:123 start_codon:yes stop_codon:yes gene_type:complete